MNGWTRGISIAVTLWIAAALQQAMVRRLSIFGFEPDFMLLALACLSMFLTRSGGAVVGFLSGAIFGAIDFANITHYVISRTVTGFATAWSKGLNLDGTVLVACITVAASTAFARIILMFLAPPPLITPFLEATIRTAVYNGVLAVPVYLLLKRIMGPSTH